GRLELLILAASFICVGVTLHRLSCLEQEVERLRRRRGGLGIAGPVESVLEEPLRAIVGECREAPGDDLRSALARIEREARHGLELLGAEAERPSKEPAPRNRAAARTAPRA
ncbi:MAG: hypothetical protein ACE5JG_07255, partial [Planctomycetota bacterium]